MLTINYTIHPEEWRLPEFKISEEEYKNLENHKKPLGEFLIKEKI